MKNLAGVMGGDIESAAALLGRAMMGSTEQLSRYGIHVDQAASQTEKLRQVMEQAAQRGGGSMDAFAETVTGKWAKVKNSLGDIAGGVGAFLMQGDKGTDKNVLDYVNQLFTGIGDKLARVIPAVADFRKKQEEAKAASQAAKAAIDAQNASLAEQENRARALIEDLGALAAAWDKEAKAKADRVDHEEKKQKGLLDIQIAQIEHAEKAGRITEAQARLAKENVTTRREKRGFEDAQWDRSARAGTDRSQAEELRKKAAEIGAEATRVQAQADAAENDAQAKALQERADGLKAMQAQATADATLREARAKGIDDEIKREAELFQLSNRARLEGIKGDHAAAEAADKKKAADDKATAAAKAKAAADKLAGAAATGRAAADGATSRGESRETDQVTDFDDDGRRTTKGRNDDRRRTRPGTRGPAARPAPRNRDRGSEALMNQNSVIQDAGGKIEQSGNGIAQAAQGLAGKIDSATAALDATGGTLANVLTKINSRLSTVESQVKNAR